MATDIKEYGNMQLEIVYAIFGVTLFFFFFVYSVIYPYIYWNSAYLTSSNKNVVKNCLKTDVSGLLTPLVFVSFNLDSVLFNPIN